MPEDFDPFSRLSEEQTRAVLAEMMSSSALDNVDTMPEIKVADDGGDKCCAEAKSKWLAYLEKQFENERAAYYMPTNEFGLPNAAKSLHDGLIVSYEQMECDEFKQRLENIAGVENNHPVYGAHNERGYGLPRTPESYEAARILANWNACEFGAGEGAEDMGFYASADPFEYSWNLIIKELGGFE